VNHDTSLKANLYVGNMNATAISRPSRTDDRNGTSLTINGQTAVDGQGGDISIVAGAGAVNSGGNVYLDGGAGLLGYVIVYNTTTLNTTFVDNLNRTINTTTTNSTIPVMASSGLVIIGSNSSAVLIGATNRTATVKGSLDVESHVTAASMSVSGVLTSGSVTSVGSVSVASLTSIGAISAAAATITNGITASTLQLSNYARVNGTSLLVGSLQLGADTVYTIARTPKTMGAGYSTMLLGQVCEILLLIFPHVIERISWQQGW